MDLKEEKLLVLSIILVLISSWLVGNLMGLRREDGADTALLTGVPEDIFVGTVILVVLLSLLYFVYLYFRLERDQSAMFSGLLLFGFWAFILFGILLFVMYVIWPLLFQFDIRIPAIKGLPSIPFLPDLGFILLLGLIAILFSYLIFLKISEEKEKKVDMSVLELDGLKKTKLDKDEEDKIEKGLTSSLDRAITDIDKGADIRTTIIGCYRKMSRFLEKRGAKNEVSMTPREFKEIIIEEMPGTENMITEMTFLFEEARYSPHELRERDKNRVLKHLRELKEGIE